MSDLKRNLLSVALASAIVSLAATAQAQESATQEVEGEEATELDRITVTGIRAGIENAIDVKQSSTSIVEAISAEDIGKLPDLSIADSLARLPGLTAQRDRGRPQEINIRGLSGDFATTTLNGREQVSLGNNRGVEFDQYPSELINQVLVYKTPDAALVNQGLSGTIDLQTVRPLAFGERVIAANVRGDMNRLGSDREYGNRYSLSYIDQFSDNRIGLALGYARLNNPGQANEFESWGYDNGALGGGKLYRFENDNTRDGFMGVLEFAPNDRFTSVLDVYYSRFDKAETKRGAEFGLAFGGATLVNRSDSPNGTALSMDWENPSPVVLRNDFNGSDDRLSSIGWRNELRLTDRWTMHVDLSSSRARRDERILETYGGIPGASDFWRVNFNPDGYFDFDVGLDYADPSIVRLGDAGGWGQDGYLKDFQVRDSIDAIRLDFERQIDNGPLSGLRFGANYANRAKSRGSNENFLCLVACNDGAQVEVPADLLTGSDFGFAGISGFLGWDALTLLDRVYNLRGNENPDIANKNWEVRESVTTGYVQLDIDADLGRVPVRGNVGVQVVDVDQRSDGFATYAGNPVGDFIEGGASYRDYLPSLNLSFQLPAENFIRFGAARQVARPRMDEMRANAGYGVDRSRPGGPIWSGGGGNPELEPWRANAYDLAWEKYFGGRGYFSVAYFYKDLRNYIFQQIEPFDFSGLAIPEDVLPGDIPASPIGEFSRPANGQGGVLKGWEFAVSVPFDLLWEPLEGFGLQASYTDSTTSIEPDGPGTATPLPGFSKYTSNVTLYYERFGFSTRVSRRSRSEFLGEVQGFGGDRERIFFSGEAVVDLQVGYQLQSGPLEGLTFLAQVNNLTDEPFRSNFDGLDDRPRQFFEYGRNYLFGVNYRF